MAKANLTPPPALDGSRVLAYAILDDSVVHTGRSTLYVDGKSLGPVPRLAICQDRESRDVLLLFCDDKWRSLGVTSCPSLKEAQQRAESEYRGVSAKWVNVVVSDEEVVQHVRQQFADQICSFCRKRPDQIEQMFQGPNVRICNECVESFYNNLT